MTQIRVEKFNILDNLAAYESSFAQINQDKLFLCGGIERGTQHTISNQTAVFDFEAQTFSNLPPMEIPKYRHGLIVMDTSVYCIGGGSNGSVDSNSVEKYNFKYQQWNLCRAMKYPRVLPTIVASQGTKKLYVFGGASKRKDNTVVETYSCPSDKWSTLNVTLPEPFNNLASFAVLIPAFSATISTYANYDTGINTSSEDDKIIILNYGAVSKEPPKMYLLNLKT